MANAKRASVNWRGSAIPHAAIGQRQPGNFAIEALRRQTTVGIIGCNSLLFYAARAVDLRLFISGVFVAR
jgi:hypothetical protein